MRTTVNLDDEPLVSCPVPRQGGAVAGGSIESDLRRERRGMRVLPDVNVLVALADAGRLRRAAARRERR